jgi:hypothetical protein
MAEKEQPRQQTHRAYSVIRREGQDDYWLNIGLVFPHKDGGGFNLILQAFPLDGKIVVREIADERAEETTTPPRGGQDPPRSSKRAGDECRQDPGVERRVPAHLPRRKGNDDLGHQRARRRCEGSHLGEGSELRRFFLRK